MAMATHGIDSMTESLHAVSAGTDRKAVAAPRVTAWRIRSAPDLSRSASWMSPVPSAEPRTHPAETRATCRLAQWLDRQLLLGRVAEVTDDGVELRVARLQPA
jgi:hypothetical protein